MPLNVSNYHRDPAEENDDTYSALVSSKRDEPPLTAISFAVIGEFALLLVLCCILLLYRLWSYLKLKMNLAEAKIEKSTLGSGRESISVTDRDSSL